MGMSSAMLMLGERDMGGSVYLQWRISRFQFASLARFRFRKEMEGMAAGRFVKRQTAVGKNMSPPAINSSFEKRRWFLWYGRSRVRE